MGRELKGRGGDPLVTGRVRVPDAPQGPYAISGQTISFLVALGQV